MCGCCRRAIRVLSNTLINPRKTFRKVLSKQAAQTRYGAIKSAPLIKDCKQYPLSLVPTAAKAACSTEMVAHLAILSANAVR